MIEDISGVTPKLVMAALDGLLLRHQVISHNIANASTPNYSAQKVSFEEYMATMSLEASNDAEKSVLTEQVEKLNTLISEKDSLVTTTGSKVELDKEVVALTENVLKYRALLQANSTRGEILGMAIRGRGR